MKRRLELLEKISLLPGVPGQEQAVRSFIETEIKNDVDALLKDNLGSLIAKKNGQGPKVMIAGHMDEVGLLVTQITSDGFIKFQTLGGWYSQVMLAHTWDIHTPQGIVVGVTGAKPPHMIPADQRKHAVEIDAMFIDIGVQSKAEALELGVLPGQMITPRAEFKTLGHGKYLLSKAWDNRIGSAVVIEVLKNLKDTPNELFATFTVMEEVGLRGAKTSSYVANPEIAIAIDSGIGNDVPGGDKAEQSLGKGPQILLYDAGLIPNQALRNHVIDIADKAGIPYQEAVVTGGRTDAGHMHLAKEGALGLSVCIPTRNLHSHTSIIHYDDFENTVKLITKVVQSLTRAKVDELLNQ